MKKLLMLFAVLFLVTKLKKIEISAGKAKAFGEAKAIHNLTDCKVNFKKVVPRHEVKAKTFGEAKSQQKTRKNLSCCPHHAKASGEAI